MMNREIYAQIEKELEKHRVREEAEDILLGMAEEIADSVIFDRDVIKKTELNGTVIEACGVHESDGEQGVLIKWLRIGRTEIAVDDYFL